jgi:hypothetical protein
MTESDSMRGQGANDLTGSRHQCERSELQVDVRRQPQPDWDLVDSALELLQELINVQKIALGPQIGKWERIRVMHGRMSRLSDHCTTMPILGHATGVVTTTAAAAENWELYSLQAHQTLSNIIVSGRVNGSALSVAKKLIQSVISRTLSDLVVVVQLLRLVDSIVNRTISRVLWWTTVKSSRGTSRLLLAIAAVWTKRAIGILISTRCSGKRLQVSDHCSAPVRK